jgi:membrane protein DedA with SNARE-associated domain
VETILPFLREWHLLGMFGALLACGFGFPMPEDIILIAGGILAQQEGGPLWPSFLVAYAGVIIGDGIMFTIGRTIGPRVLAHPFVMRIFTPARRGRVEHIFARWGAYAVFMGRFAAGVRAWVFLTAGAMKVRTPMFIVFDSLAAFMSVPLFIWVGYKFGENIDAIKRAKIIVGIIVGAAFLAYLGYTLWRRRKEKRAAMHLERTASESTTPAP